MNFIINNRECVLQEGFQTGSPWASFGICTTHASARGHRPPYGLKEM